MPRVTFVKKAQKDNPVAKKGESYYWWKHRIGRSSIKKYSKTRPKPSQLTMSEYLGQCYAAEERFAEDVGTIEDEADCENAVSTIEDIKGELEGVLEETECKRDNMQDAWPNGCPSLEIIEQRCDALPSVIDSLDTVISELQDIDWDDVNEDEVNEDEGEDGLEAQRDAAQAALENVDWTFE